MGKIIIYGNKSGEGGVDTSDVTATSSDVLVGKVIVDAEGEIVAGSMPNRGAISQTLDAGGSYTIPEGYHNGSGKITTKTLASQTDGTATAEQILNGSTAYVDGVKITGTMTNQGSKSQSLNAGSSYTIPAGYHDGTGKVTANDLTGQTPGTASAGEIIKDKTAWVNGSQITGIMTNHGAVAPSALGAGGSYTIPAGYHNGQGKVTVQSLATITASADAGAGEILSGKKAYVDGTLVTGTMTNQGAKTSSLNCGGSYTIPAGYHNGSGKITANSLASQTDATATAAQILSGKTAWVKGSKLTGTLAVTSAISFKAATLSDTSIRISWTNPSKGPYSGVKIRMSTSGYPGVSGGTLKYTGSGSSTTAGGSSYVDITGLTYGTTYYFTCYSYCTGLGDSTSGTNINGKTSATMFNNGTFYNGFSIHSASLGVGKTTAYVSGSTLYIPYDSSADGICNLNVPSGFDASKFSYCCFDLYFNTVSYCGGVNGGPYEDNTDYAWYYMGVQLPGAGGGYEYDILDDNAKNRLTIRVPLSAKTQTYAWFYPRSMRNSSYAATPTTYIYKIWFE